MPPPSTSEPEEHHPTAESTGYQPATADRPAKNVPVPELPEVARELSEAGLKAFSEYWYATSDYLFETGVPGPLVAACSEVFEACGVLADGIVKIYEGGGWIVGGDTTARGAGVQMQPDTNRHYFAVVDIKQSGATIYNHDGTLATEVPEDLRILVELTAGYVDGAWHRRTLGDMARKLPDLSG